MKRILAIDDDRNVLSAVYRSLRRSGYEVLAHENPRHALRSLSHSWPDLILLDVSMPTMSGHEVLRRFRRLESMARRRSGTARRSRTPVIFLSGLAATHQVVAGFDAGISDYITKPFDSDALRARIRNQLRLMRDADEDLMHAERAGGLKAQRLTSAIESCGDALCELDINLTLAEEVRREPLQRRILARAKENISQIRGELAQVVMSSKGEA